MCPIFYAGAMVVGAFLIIHHTRALCREVRS